MEKSIFPLLLRDRDALNDKILEGRIITGEIVKLFFLTIALLAIYGLVMGLFNSFLQAITSAIKVPLMFFLAFLICFPALFMSNILLGSKLDLKQSIALIISSFAMIACILASFASIPLFFMLIGSSYAFLRLLHVAIFAIAGFAGMKILNNGLVYACEKYSVYPKQGVRVFKIWVLIFAFVGTQLAWNLRPFLGNKEMEFQLLRKQESNFYAHVLHTAREFVFGKPEKPIVDEKPDYLNIEEYRRIQNERKDSAKVGEESVLPKEKNE